MKLKSRNGKIYHKDKVVGEIVTSDVLPNGTWIVKSKIIDKKVMKKLLEEEDNSLTTYK